MIESAEEFVRLRCSAVPEEYRRAAKEEAPDDVWLEIIHRFPEMRFWVAQNKTVQISILTLLATDQDSRVRGMVASKRKLNDKLFDVLSRDRSDSVRHKVAANKKAPTRILVRLANDRVRFVARAAAQQIKERNGS